MVHFEYLIDKIIGVLDGWKAKLLSFGGKVTLIKVVLSSVPIYTMASTLIPVTVLKRMERLMANSLWSSKAKTWAHGVRWEKICLPESVGGLGIRGFQHVQHGLHAKLMWLVMRGGSLWADFARARYYVDNKCTTPSSSSPIWRSIVEHWPILMTVARWIVGEENIRFWTDNWSEEVLFGPSPHDQLLTVAEAVQNREAFTELLTTE